MRARKKKQKIVSHIAETFFDASQIKSLVQIKIAVWFPSGPF